MDPTDPLRNTCFYRYRCPFCCWSLLSLTSILFLALILLCGVLQLSVADPDPGSGAFLTPGSGIGFFRIPELGSRISNSYF